MSVLAFMGVVQSGLTLGQVIADIPHDTPAIVVYVMLLVSIYIVWRANRPRRRS